MVAAMFPNAASAQPLGAGNRMTDMGITCLTTFTQLRSLEARDLPDVTHAGWLQLRALNGLTHLSLTWDGAMTVQLLQQLQHLPLEQVSLTAPRFELSCSSSLPTAPGAAPAGAGIAAAGISACMDPGCRA